jgi:hypothetical protein
VQFTASASNCSDKRLRKCVKKSGAAKTKEAKSGMTRTTLGRDGEPTYIDRMLRRKRVEDFEGVDDYI